MCVHAIIFRRSHVSCRLAYLRVSTLAVATASARGRPHEMRCQRRHPERPHDRQLGGKALRQQRPHLVQGSGRQHGIEAGVDLARRGLGGQAGRRSRTVSASASTGRPGSRCHSARERPVLSSTSSARTMRWGSVGISRAAVSGSRWERSACNSGAGPAGRLGAPEGPHLRVGGRDRRQALQQRLEIEPGAADDDRHPPCGLRLRDGLGGVGGIAPGRIGLRPADEAVEHMRRPRLVLRAGRAVRMRSSR